MCEIKKIAPGFVLSAAARQYADAFAAEPKLADGLRQQPRYHAACKPALATAEQTAASSAELQQALQSFKGMW